MIYDGDEMHARWCTIGYEMHARSCMIGTNCVHGRRDCIMTQNCMLETGDLYKIRRRKKNCMHKRSKCHHEPRKNTKMTKETKKKRASRTSKLPARKSHHTPNPANTPQKYLLQTFNHSPARPVPHSLFINSAHDDSPLDLIPSFLSLPPSDARHQTTITHTAYTALRDVVHIALFLHS